MNSSYGNVRLAVNNVGSSTSRLRALFGGRPIAKRSICRYAAKRNVLGVFGCVQMLPQDSQR
jgi:hypothetical protein